MTTNKSVLLVGGTDAGKSNYIFRLWLALDSEHGELKKNGLPENVEYLEEGASALLGGQFAGRTEQETPHEISIPVTWSVNGRPQSGLLQVPDCAGEQWQKVFKRREWSADWENLVTAAVGCLVFIRSNSEENIPSLDWITCARYFGEPIPLGNDIPAEETAPTQVVLVDLIQCLSQALRTPNSNLKPRVGIVISAWDAVTMEMMEAGPLAFIEDNFPLLGQFIEANADEIEFQVFGVSVVDGDLNDEIGFRQKYYAQNPSETGSIVWMPFGNLERSSDMAVPVLWAMGLAASERLKATHV